MDTKALRQKILDLAIRGKLVPQDPNDEPASFLLERIRSEKERLIKEGKIKRSKKSSSDTPHYEKEVPFEIPKNWVWCSLSDYSTDITDFVASGSFASLRENVNYYNDPNYAILVRTKDFQNNFSEALVYVDKKGYDFLENSHLFGSELILPNIGASIGKAFIVPKLQRRMTLGPNAILIKTLNNIDTKWLYLFFLSGYGNKVLKSISSSSAQGKFNKTDLRKVIIPIPPENERSRIINLIEDSCSILKVIDSDKVIVSDLISQAKFKILSLAIQGKLVAQNPSEEKSADLLKRINPGWKPTDKSHYRNVPNGWCISTLEFIGESELGKTLDREKNKGDLKPYLCSLNVIWNDFNLHTIKKMKIEKDELERYLIQKGDLPICEGGEVGRSAIWNSCEEIYYQNSLHRVRFKDELDPRFFMYLFMYLKNIGVLDKYSKGMTIKHLTKTSLMSIPLIVPPLNEQKRIAKKIEDLFELLDSISEQLI